MFRKKTKTEAVVYIYESEIKAITAEAKQFPAIETGGDLFGTFTHGNMPIVWLASGPGPKARHYKGHFEQDTPFTTYWQRRLMGDFGIQYIGSWHSHHILSLLCPSAGDSKAAQRYALNHGRQRTVEIIVNLDGENSLATLRPYYYPQAQKESWIPASFNLKAGESPLRERLGKDEPIFSAQVDWRQVPDQGSYELAFYQSSGDMLEPREKGEKSFPDKLQTEIERLTSQGISVEVEHRGDIFMVILHITAERLLAAAVEDSKELKIIQVNHIDSSCDTSTDITEMLSSKDIKLSISENSGVLEMIISMARQYLSDGNL